MATTTPPATDPAPATGVEQAMVDYYARRAAYYERVYFKPERQDELRRLAAMLPACFAGRRVLEVACGTGWWTPHGARDAAAWLATDINPETLAIARTKTLPPCVQFAAVDAWTWQGLDSAPPGVLPGDALQGPFDAAFAGCWWSHVPLQRLRTWLDGLRAQLLPGARVVFLDNSFTQTSSSPISRRDEHGNTYQQRGLDDGSVHEVVKNFPSQAEAATQLGAMARRIEWLELQHFWLLSCEFV